MAEITTESLSLRTYEHLLQNIREGRWQDGLPAERKLAALLGVSRPVLRDALQLLEEKELLKRVGRKRIPQIHAVFQEEKKNVLVVHSSKEASMPGSTATMLKLMTEGLIPRSVKVHSTVCSELRAEEVGAELARVENEYPNDIWVLRSPSEAALKWCQKHHPRCVVIGSQPSRAYFSGVDLDVDSMFHHSLELCFEKGKENVVFIIPPGKSHATKKLEDFVSRQSVHGGTITVQGLSNQMSHEAKRQIMHLLGGQPRPNAFVCTNFQHWLMIYSLLTEAGISPLKDVFLLCHYSDRLMECISHGVGYYSFDWVEAANFLTEKICAMGKHSTPEVLLLQPHYLIS